MEQQLQHAIAAIKLGDHKTGHQALCNILQTAPNNEQAWLWMSSVVDSDQQCRHCLERVLAINPANTHAQRGLITLLTRWSTSLTSQHEAQQQLSTDRGAFDIEKATLRAQQEQLDADRNSLKQAQETLHVQHEQFAHARIALQADCIALQQPLHTLSECIQELTKREQCAKVEAKRLQAQRDRLTKREQGAKAEADRLQDLSDQLTKREQRANAEVERLQGWSDQLIEREEVVGEREWFAWQQQFVDPQHTVLEPPILKEDVYTCSDVLSDMFGELITIPYNQSCGTPHWQKARVHEHEQALKIIKRGV